MKLRPRRQVRGPNQKVRGGRFREQPAIRRLKAVARWPLALVARHRERVAGRTIEVELAVCAVFRDEAPFLEEWLTFHRGVKPPARLGLNE